MTTQPTSGTITPAKLLPTSNSPQSNSLQSNPQSGGLQTSEGTTSISNSVVQKIAGMAASDVSGVYRLGGGAANAISSLKNRLPGSSAPSVTQGVSVDVGEVEASVVVNLTAEYGVAIQDVAAAVRRNVKSAVTRMTGLAVTAVDVNVDDVHLPTDADTDPSQS